MFGQVYKCCQCIATTCKQVAQWISVGLWWLLLSLHAISRSTRSHSFSCQVGTSMHSCKQCKHKQILLQAFSGIHWSIFLTSTTVPVLRWWEKLRVSEFSNTGEFPRNGVKVSRTSFSSDWISFMSSETVLCLSDKALLSWLASPTVCSSESEDSPKSWSIFESALFHKKKVKK